MAVFVLAGAAPATAAEQRDISVYFGRARASLGTWFGKLAIGSLDAPPLPQAASGVTVEVVTTGRRLDGVDIKFPADACADLQARLTHLWGAPNVEGWQAASGGQGATLETSVDIDGGCRLRFFRRVSPEQWLSWSRRSVVPLWAIGKPAAELESALAVLAPTREDQEIHWQDTSIDGSHVALSATVRGDRIVNVTVSTEIDSHVTPVWQRLRKMFGPPDSATTDEDTYRWRWRHAPRIEVSTFVGDRPPPRPGVTRPPDVMPKTPSDPGFPLSIVFGAE